jgi:hypothetical protein
LIAGIYLVTRKNYPHKIFETPHKGATWLEAMFSRQGVELDVDRLVAAAEKTRAAIG